ncbi:MAG: UPF0280 family protein [Desulfobacterales bacterium]|nr:MAG: UPF0280 family protein [Desulfobacterales bacterium]
MKHERTYRHLVRSVRLQSFQVVVKETDLLIHASTNLAENARELVLQHRGYIEAYLKRYPAFGRTLEPWYLDGPAPEIVTRMTLAGQKAAVGPMAAVAGAIAEQVGRGLLSFTDEVIVENGGDIFLKSQGPVTIGLFAGKSPLSLRFGIRLEGSQTPQAVCTSSGTVGHSLSLGRADAVCVISESCPLADAAATSIGNLIQSKADIHKAFAVGQKIEGITGLAVIVDDELGVWGELKVLPLNIKKG